MSTIAIGERPFIDPTIQDVSLNQGAGEGFWLDRIVKNAIEVCSSSQVQIVCSRIFAVIALAAAGVVAGLAAFSIVALPFAVVAIPAVLLAGYALWYSTQFDEYEESEMLTQLREEAEGMTLDEVVARHGWDKIFEDQILSPSQFATQYRRHVRAMESINDVTKCYKKVLRHAALHNNDGARSASFVSYFVPHPREEAHRWHREIENLSFKEIIDRYPVQQFENLGIIGHNEMQKIRELLNTYQPMERIFKGYEDAAKAVFDQATRVQRELLDADIDVLKRGRDENPLIHERNELANLQFHSELRIRNEFGEQLRQVREQHEQTIARLGNGRAVIRENLSPESREEYDRSVQELFENDRRIRQTMDTQLRADQAFFAQRKVFLEDRCERICADFERDKAEREDQFHAETRVEREVKEAALRPHQEQLDNIVANLTLQYRAYFGQFRR